MTDTPTTAPETQDPPKVRRKNPVTIDASAKALTYAEVLEMDLEAFVAWCVQEKCDQITASVRAQIRPAVAP